MVGGISRDLRQPVLANGSANGCARNRLTSATTERHQTKHAVALALLRPYGSSPGITE